MNRTCVASRTLIYAEIFKPQLSLLTHLHGPYNCPPCSFRMSDSDDQSMNDAASSADESASGSDGERSRSPEVEALVAGREKRATAGNRMSAAALALQEELGDEDDEVVMLFASEGEDDEFAGSDEDVSDAQLSSSEDDDQGPNAAPDDLEGEKELQRREKAQRMKKRKAKDALTTAEGVRKKARFAPTSARPAAPAPKPSKKKERQSWLPESGAGPSRTSLRAQTQANTEITRTKVKQHDELHAKLVERNRKRQQQREKEKPKEMTQADRLAEAERIERKNAKSLNRWEEMEKKRAEEQAAKLAALHDRTLDGPVVSYWSGVAKWLGPKLVKVGKQDTSVEPAIEGKKRGRKPNGYWEALEASKAAELDGGSCTGTPQDQATTPAPSDTATIPSAATEPTTAVPEPVPKQLTFTEPQGPDNFLHGIHEYASLPPEQAPIAALSPRPGSQPASVHPPMLLPPTGPAVLVQAAPQPPQPPRLPLVEEIATRNLVVLSNFEDLAEKDKESFSFFTNAKKVPKVYTKLTRPAPELCAITSLPARYRDPSTGMLYANSAAYQKLQDIKKHRFTWSSMLGGYVGTTGVAARGVPEGFSGS